MIDIGFSLHYLAVTGAVIRIDEIAAIFDNDGKGTVIVLRTSGGKVYTPDSFTFVIEKLQGVRI